MIWLDWDLLLLFLSLDPSHFLSPAGQLERVLLFYFNWGGDVIGLLHAGLFNFDPAVCVCVCIYEHACMVAQRCSMLDGFQNKRQR